LAFPSNEEKGHTHTKMFVFAENHKKNILMKCVSVLSSTGTGQMPIKQHANKRTKVRRSIPQDVV